MYQRGVAAEAVGRLRAVAFCAGHVAFETLAGGFVGVESVWTVGDASAVCGGRRRRKSLSGYLLVVLFEHDMASFFNY